MDEIDAGQETDQFLLEVALRNAKKATLPFIGRCHNCDCKLNNRNFCDNDCRDDYEKRNEAKKPGGAS